MCSAPVRDVHAVTMQLITKLQREQVFLEHIFCLLKAMYEEGTTNESRDGGDKHISAAKKQINRTRWTPGFSRPALWMSSGVGAVLFSWPSLRFEVLPFPSPEPKRGGCTAFGSGCTGKARQRCILQERLRLLNQALTMELRGREGEGRRQEQEQQKQRGWEPGSRNGGSEGGTKETQGRGSAGSHQG